MRVLVGLAAFTRGIGTPMDRMSTLNNPPREAAAPISARFAARAVRAIRSALSIAAGLIALSRVARAQERYAASPPNPAAVRAPVPFSSGEVLSYEVRFGALKVGSGQMEVLGTQDVRGREAWHTRFTVKGGVPFYRVNDRLESWIDTRELHSLRFVQDLQEGRRDREYTYEIYPDRAVFFEGSDSVPKPSVADPLDDAAFLYFVRTVPLEIGQTYEFNRYFRPDRNPVTIRVLRREKIKVPAGEFETVVVQPIIKAKGIFSEKGHAEIWLTDDAQRVMVQMKSGLSIGSLNLYLTKNEPGGIPFPASR
jgi:hypothetical protein